MESKEWAPIAIFADKHMSIKATASSIDSIRIIDGCNQIVPYITRSDLNNGVSRFVDSENLKKGFDGPDCISAGLDTQTAFYQPYAFVTGQNVQIISSEKMNEYIGLFLCATLKHQMKARFNWGGNGATLGRLKKARIMLPVDESGQPDYVYMEQYSKTKKNELISRYCEYVKEQIKNLQYIAVPDLKDKRWGAFEIRKIADYKNSRPYHSNCINVDKKGILPYVTRTAENNGYFGFAHNNPNFKLNPGNTISFGAETAEFFYQPDD